MTIRVECPSCGAAFKAPADAIGRRAKCRKCGQAFTLSEVPEIYSVAPVLDVEDFVARAEGAAARTPAVAQGAHREIAVAPTRNGGAVSCTPGTSPGGHRPTSSALELPRPWYARRDTYPSEEEYLRADALVTEGVAAGVLVSLANLVMIVGGWLSAWGLIDVGLAAGLAFGIHRRSRVCAVLLLAKFVGERVWLLGGGFRPNPIGIAIAVVLALGLVRGLVGTIRYHRIA